MLDNFIKYFDNFINMLDYLINFNLSKLFYSN